MIRLTQLPFIVSLMGIGSLAMLVPALHAALAVDDPQTARVFLYGAIMGSVLTIAIGLATQGYSPPDVARSQLTSLLAAFTGLPILFAVPFREAAFEVSYLNAWFEMVSSFTTTGATLYPEPNRLPPSVHLWRAMVGWMGGLLLWITAVAILAPMNIGGFEVRARGRAGGEVRRHMRAQMLEPAERLIRYGLTLTPIYLTLTFVLFLALIMSGDLPLVAASHAMSVMATSGISPIGGVQNANTGVLGEVLIFTFLVFALSRLTFSRGVFSNDSDTVWKDPELRLGVVIVMGVPLLLFLRHFIGAIDTDAAIVSSWDGLRALWGAMFTVMSFLTTTGFESVEWTQARDWSGLRTPGLVLVGVALIGGGVATTAGGVKLLRVYALVRHGERELHRLVHPHSVGGGGREARRIRKQGAYISWIFFMLVALSIALVMLLLSLTGIEFEDSMVLAVAAISTTGPLAEVAAEAPIFYADIPDFAKVILAATMVLGRLETLALISLLNPEFWRR